MASRGGTIIVLASLALVVGQLGFPQPKQSTTILQGATTSEAAVADTTVSSKRSELPPWEIDYSSSAIKFTGDQAGAPFIGQWQQWQADIQFDSNNLDDSRFDVKIDIASVASGDETRDEHIVSEDFFHQESFAYARFVARDFSATQSGFETTAELTMKGITKPALFRFSVQEEGDKRVLSGKATLDRLAWNIGVGDWSDTSWVGQQVTVDVTVTTTTATATGNK
jgi:polyisoprenoid-binding protein YceI